MKNYIIQLTLIISLLSFNYIKSQVVASDDVVLCDGQQGQTEVTLTATSFAMSPEDEFVESTIIYQKSTTIDFEEMEITFRSSKQDIDLLNLSNKIFFSLYFFLIILILGFIVNYLVYDV